MQLWWQVALAAALLLLTGARATSTPNDTHHHCPAKCNCQPAPVDAAHAEGVEVERAVRCEQMPELAEVVRIVQQLQPPATSLSLTRSSITQLRQLCCLYDLRTLNVSHNRLSSVEMIDAFPRLRQLDLSANNFDRITRHMFRPFPNVQVLNVGRNQISVLNAESLLLWHLRELDLSHNRLETIDEHTFRYCAKLQKINLHHNRLRVLGATTFYFSTQLIELDLSHNQITHVQHQAFLTLANLRRLDLSHNLLSVVPSTQLQHLESVHSIWLGANQFSTLTDEQPISGLLQLQHVDLSQSPALRLVLSGALTHLPHLRTLNLSHCQQLAYVSNTAIQESSSLSALDLTGTAVRSVWPQLLQQSDRVLVGDAAQLDCACSGPDQARLVNAPDGCFSHDQCHEALYVWPQGTLEVDIGETVYLHCVAKRNDTHVHWRLPSGRLLQSEQHPQPAVPVAQDSPEHFVYLTGRQAWPKRTVVTNEYLRFDFVTLTDSGTYVCGAGPDSDGTSVRLSVNRPNIQLLLVDVSAMEASFAWNDTIKTSSRRIRAYLIYRQQRSDNIPTMARIIQLPVENPWFSYTVNRLRPTTNYTFCLTFNYQLNESLYESCVELTTAESSSLGDTLVGYTVGRLPMPVHMYSSVVLQALCMLVTFVALLCVVCVARCLHRRFYIWQEEKYRSRVAMSVSGQSFLSSADSLHTTGGRSVTFENIPMSSSVYERCSSRRSKDIRDMPL